MFRRSISWLICTLIAACIAAVYRDPDYTTEWSVTEPVREATHTAADDLGALLDAGDGATVTVVAGNTRLAAHRAVLAARSPVLAAMLSHYSVETAGGQLRIPGVGGPALRQLISYLYTLRAPQSPGIAPQLLAAADRLGLAALKAHCERQLAAQLSVETAAAVAVLAVKHRSDHLRDAAVLLILDHLVAVRNTNGWEEAVTNQPIDMAKVVLLLFDRVIGSSAAATTQASATPTSRPPIDQTTPAAAPAAATTSTPTDEGATVSRQPSLSDSEKGKRLIEMAEDGAVEELQSLLEAGADVGTRDQEGSTSLHWAAYRGHTGAARSLLDAGADVNARDNWQISPLHVAAWKGHAAMVRLLAVSGADLNARDNEGRTPLHLAVMRGLAKVVAALLEAGANREATDQNGNTPLDIFRQNNSQQLMVLLSASPCSVPATTEAETTTEDCTTAEDSANITAVTAAPLPAACPTSPLDEDTVSCLRNLRPEEKGWRLIQAAKEGAVGELEALLAAGADVDTRDRVDIDQRRRTALHWAAQMGHVEVVQRLLARGADVDARSAVLNTPLHWAAYNGHPAVARLLLAASANHSPKQREGWTPLHFTAEKNHPDVAAVLLEAGADTKSKNDRGETPLEVARRYHHEQVVDILELYDEETT